MSPVNDLSLKENVEKLLEVKNKIENVLKKITMQDEEILKTEDIIEKFKTCHNQQKEALQKVE